MSFGNNSINQDALLKDLYSEERVADYIKQRNRFYGLVKKTTISTGRSFDEVVIHAPGGSRSATFTAAQNQAANSGLGVAQFKLPMVENSNVCNISAKFVKQTKNNAGSFLAGVKPLADRYLDDFAFDVNIGMYRNSTGVRAQLASTVNVSSSTGVLTFVLPKDVLNFTPGMAVDFSTSATGTSVEAYGSNNHAVYFGRVDYSSGKVTVTTTPQGTTPVAANDAADGCPTVAPLDYVFAAGDKSLKLNGFDDWIVYGGVASNDSFLGVNRSTNSLLAGNYLDGTADPLEVVLENAIAQVGEVGGSLTHFLLPFKKYAKLSQSLGSKGTIPMTKVMVSPTVGYDGIKIAGDGQEVICLQDRAVPSNSIKGINLDTWELRSVDPMVHVWDDDGRIWNRSQTQNGMEIRFYSFGNLCCTDPRSNINIRVNP